MEREQKKDYKENSEVGDRPEEFPRGWRVDLRGACFRCRSGSEVL